MNLSHRQSAHCALTIPLSTFVLLIPWLFELDQPDGHVLVQLVEDDDHEEVRGCGCEGGQEPRLKTEIKTLSFCLQDIGVFSKDIYYIFKIFGMHDYVCCD